MKRLVGRTRPVAAVFLAIILLSGRTVLAAGKPTTAAERVRQQPEIGPDAVDVVNAYRHGHFVPPFVAIPDGFVDGGRGMSIRGDRRVSSHREITTVDRTADTNLCEQLKYARSKKVMDMEPYQRAQHLGQYVDGIFNPPGGRRAAKPCSEKLAAQFRSKGVLLGDVVPLSGGGVCRHRMLLFKILCNEAKIGVSMVRGYYRHSDGRLGGHAWNEVHLPDGRVLLADVMSPPRGWAYPVIGTGRRGDRYLTRWKQQLYAGSKLPPRAPWIAWKKSLSLTKVKIIPPTTVGVTLHYTLNGTAPTAKSAKYSKVISVRKPTVVKALAVYEDGVSPVVEKKVGG